MDSSSTARETNLIDTLQGWVRVGALRALDLALARFISAQTDEHDDAVLLATALTSERNGHGHVCLDLQAAHDAPEDLLGRLRDDQGVAADIQLALASRLDAFSLSEWVARVAASPAVSDLLNTGEDDGASPLVLAGTRSQPLLYLRRYWHYEQVIRDGIAQRLTAPPKIDPLELKHQLQLLFAEPAERGDPNPNWQRIACALAARSAFFIVTGGPGTGKTTTVVRLLALLQGLQAAAGDAVLRIELAAPTGKAAARLNASIADQVRGLTGPMGPPQSIPTRVKTLHRLLGSIPDSRHFRHHAANPLSADLIVIDEASMVDVEMMARLLDAMRPDARLILLGDKDQLSSVEAGAILGDLCQRAARAHYRPDTAAWLSACTGDRIPEHTIDPDGGALDQSVVMLRTSYRFSAEGGIGALAACVNDAPLEPTETTDHLGTLLALFEQKTGDPDGTLGVIRAVQLTQGLESDLLALISAGYGGQGSYLRLMRDEAPEASANQATFDDWARRVLDAHRGFQLLTPLRQGTWGVDGLNLRIIEHLRTLRLLDPAGATPTTRRQWFPGRPVLVTRNDYSLDLMNGDIGITFSLPLHDPASNRAGHSHILRVAFPTTDGRLRWVLPSRLHTVDTVFAMTVHKSQGSEFDHTALILPDRPNPVLTRELLYTAITRAKTRFTLVYSDEAVLREALKRRVQRVSGLKDLASLP